ncbi:DUF58 domain-containing protein [Dyella jiangningensis]|uniref:DUF58 domain-containing protein n=1 Tax=Dyella jiangningensis TaxID=1379159 RepID=A0A328P5F7_9GAMM|nr:DUF58 domain-containing protein [Dyella jiangningensis]RAO76860.1 DUF58 domain-containing protein [Dyella jiangningensis]
MSALLDTSDGDGRTRVRLAELVALRGRVAKAALPRLESHAMRAGQQHSRLYGRGMDYAESRVYQPGDDVRRMDWRLTARSGRLHTKLFQEEREGRLLILLDTHASMRFGTRARFKSVQAARAAALAAWYVVRAGERVGVMELGGGQRLLRPLAGTRGALAVCGALADLDSATTEPMPESLSDAVLRAQRLARGANRILIISDGLSCDEAARGRLLDLGSKAGVRVLVVADALELALPPAGRYPLEHEGERRDVVLFGERQRREFQQVLGAGQTRLNALAQSLGIPHRTIDTASDPLDAVMALLSPGVRR